MASMEQAAARLRLLRLCPSAGAPREAPGARCLPAGPSPAPLSRTPGPSPAEHAHPHPHPHGASKLRRGAGPTPPPGVGSRAAPGVPPAFHGGPSCSAWKPQATQCGAQALQCGPGIALRGPPHPASHKATGSHLGPHIGPHQASPCFSASARDGAAALPLRAMPGSSGVRSWTAGAIRESAVTASLDSAVTVSQEAVATAPPEFSDELAQTREGQGQGQGQGQGEGNGQGHKQGRNVEDVLLQQLTALVLSDDTGHSPGDGSRINVGNSTDNSGVSSDNGTSSSDDGSNHSDSSIGTAPTSSRGRGAASRDDVPQRKVEARRVGMPGPSKGGPAAPGGAGGALEERGEGGEEGKGRGLFTLCAVEKGELLLSVPTSNIIFATSCLPPEISAALPESASPYARLSLFLMLRPDHPHLRPLFSLYLRSLPGPASLHPTILWTDAELALLPPRFVADVRDRLGLISFDFQSVQPVLEQQGHHFVDGSSRWAQFVVAYALVSSRAWYLEAALSLALVPLADMVNHDAGCPSLLRFEEEDSCAQIVAPSALEAGAEVHVSYGPYSNAILALDFGFTLPHNPHDTVEVCIPLAFLEAASGAPRDLWRLKRDLLLAADVIPSADAQGAAFCLGRVGSPAGQANKGIPHTLRVLARVMAARTHDEVAALQADLARRGPAMALRPMRLGSGRGKGREEWEGRAMLLLLETVEGLLESAERTVKIAQDAAKRCDRASNDGEELATTRVEAALQICEGQASLLRSVASWLRPRSSGGGLDVVMFQQTRR